jgi:hypothetical protein
MKTTMLSGTFGAAIALAAPAHSDVEAARHNYPRR